MNKQKYLQLKNLQHGGEQFQIYVKTLDGVTLAIDVNSNTDALYTIKEQMVSRYRERVEQQIIELCHL